MDIENSTVLNCAGLVLTPDTPWGYKLEENPKANTESGRNIMIPLRLIVGEPDRHSTDTEKRFYLAVYSNLNDRSQVIFSNAAPMSK